MARSVANDALSDGWIVNTGSNAAPKRAGDKAILRLAMGAETQPVLVRQQKWRWSILGEVGDIVAFKPVR